MMNIELDYGCGLYPNGGNMYGHTGRNGTYTTVNMIIESEQFGRIFYIASTSTDAGTYGLDAISNAMRWLAGTK